MKLTVSKVPYSSIVGGGLMLSDAKGRVRFQIVIMGTTEGISREQNAAIAQAIADGLPKTGIEVPE